MHGAHGALHVEWQELCEQSTSNNNNDGDLGRLTRTGPKRLHVLCLNGRILTRKIQHARTHARTHTHTHTHARTHKLSLSVVSQGKGC